MIYFILINIGIFLYLLTYFKSLRLLNPVGLVVIIWVLLLILSNISLTGVIVPTYDAQFYFILVICSVVLGSMFSKGNKKSVSKETTRKNHVIILIALIVCAIIPMIIPMLTTLKIIFSEGYLSFVAQTRFIGGETVNAFGSKVFVSIYYTIVRPFVYAGFFLGLSYFLLFNKKSVLLISIMMLLISAVMFTARAELLIIILGLFVMFIFGRQEDEISKLMHFKKVKKIFAVIVIFFISIVFIFSFVRSGDKLTLVDLLLHYGLNYHTFGFSMFSEALANNNSKMYELTGYGTIVISTLGWIIEQVSKLITGEINYSAARELRVEMLEEIYLGESTYLNESYHINAFYTVLYPIYSDFGFLGLIIVPFLYGYYLMHYFLSWKKVKNPSNLSMMIFLVWTGYNSLMFPAISSDYWWTILLLLLLFTRVSFLSNKTHIKKYDENTI